MFLGINKNVQEKMSEKNTQNIRRKRAHLNYVQLFARKGGMQRRKRISENNFRIFQKYKFCHYNVSPIIFPRIC